MNLEAQAQLDKPVLWFKQTVKCCYNCPSWNRDVTLMGDYAFNTCKDNIQNRLLNTCWDTWCDNYKGSAKENNLLHKIETI